LLFPDKEQKFSKQQSKVLRNTLNPWVFTSM